MAAEAHGQTGSGSKVASLGAYLLARKGGARPAMRQPAGDDGDENDLGWNDTGEAAPATASEPEVKRQQSRLVHHIADSNLTAAQARESASESAAEAARRAAFTLRLDADRHLKLRLASTVAGESAQVLVTRALDEFLARHPQIDHLASRIRGGNSNSRA